MRYMQVFTIQIPYMRIKKGEAELLPAQKRSILTNQAR